jgi:hypothetical protein
MRSTSHRDDFCPICSTPVRPRVLHHLSPIFKALEETVKLGGNGDIALKRAAVDEKTIQSL